MRETLTALNFYKKYADVQAALTAYITFRPKSVEPWMYDALALAVKENGGKDADVKKYMGYAADAAVMSRNPNHLISAADMLMMNGYYDRVGALVDQAAALIPHQGIPLVMSMNLAEKTHDPKRMGNTIEALLSLGWPGDDEVIRSNARKMAESLAKRLREEGRGKEADALLARLPEAEARDLYIRLSWTGDADLDLNIDEPLGATAQFQTPRTVFGGSIVKNGYAKHPEDVYVCPRAFDGDYAIRIETVWNNEKNPATKATVEIITHEGTPQEHKEIKTITLGTKPPAPIVVHLTGGRRKTALAVPGTPEAPPLRSATSVRSCRTTSP